MADLIELLLAQLRFKTRVFHRGYHCGQWQLDLDKSDKVLFHFAYQGGCEVVLVEEQQSFELRQGDLLLFVRPGKHIVRNLENHATSYTDDNNGLICAYVEFESGIRNYLLEALPDCVITRADAHQDDSWLKYLIGVLFSESDAEMTASQTVIERLMDILFIHVIRSYIAGNPELNGIFAAYGDAKLRTVLELMHQEPNRSWSIADFTQAANLSRSAFIAKFSNLLGISPMAYLSQQRLQYAYQQLCEGQRKVIDVAMECGYENESSFSKAFKRQHGIAPGLLKRTYFDDEA